MRDLGSLRAARRLMTGAIVAAGLGLGLAPAVQAGTYDVYGCKDPATGKALGPRDPSGWTMHDSAPSETNFFGSGTCDSDSGRLQMYPGNGGSMGSGRYASLDFNAPPDTVLRGYEIYRSLRVTNSDPWVVGVYGPNGWIEHCFRSMGTCSYGDASSPLVASNRLSATFGGQGGSALALQLFCDGTCTKSASAANATIFASRMTLEEFDKPSFTSPPSGTLLESGPVSGLRSLDFVSTDVGSGVHKITVTSSAEPDTPLASKIIDSGNGRCIAPKFTHVVPCPLSIDDSLDIDTLRFPDGPQTITVTLQDAAENAKSVSRNITVKNAPTSTADPSVPVSGTIKAGDELICNPGTFTPEPERIDFQWLVGGVVVDGATANTFTVRAGDVGKPIVCRVTAVRGGGSTTTTSPPVGGAGQPGGPGSNTQPPTTGSSVSTPATTSNTSTHEQRDQPHQCQQPGRRQRLRRPGHQRSLHGGVEEDPAHPVRPEGDAQWATAGR